MLRDVVSVQALPERRLCVRFDDAAEGVVDVTQLVKFTGVIEPLGDPEFFARVTVNRELGTVRWPNNANLDSEVLFATVAGKPVPEYESGRRPV